MEMVLEDESKESGTLNHLLLTCFGRGWGQADEASDENGAAKNLYEFHFDVMFRIGVFDCMKLD